MKATTKVRQMWPCVRCGVPAYKRGAICRDCRVGDPIYVRMVASTR